MRLENAGSGVPRVRHWKEWDKHVGRKSEDSLRMETTGIPNRSSILPGVRQLLPTLHRKLLTDSAANDGTDQEREEGMDLEARGTGSL